MQKLFSSCFRPSGSRPSTSRTVGNTAAGDGGGFEKEGTLWFRDVGNYAFGEFSMAVVPANEVLEDQSQIESGPFGTFVGIYDGHGGPEVARYVCDHLFPNLRDASNEQGVTPEAIEEAFLQTEQGFTSMVSDSWGTRPKLATMGTCCLVGVICQQTLYVANLGDSRVVLGKEVGNTGNIAAIQLSTEHNANVAAVRQELISQHPNDPQIVVFKNGVWRVKGIIQVSRSIGDAFMKYPHFNREPIEERFRIPGQLDMPFLSAKPSIISHQLQQNDSFLIFASDGLWDQLSNDEAVEIVQSNPREGSAKRLLKAALHKAARKHELRLHDICRVERKNRRHFHDDITVIVLFLNHDLIAKGSSACAPLSIRSALDQ